MASGYFATFANEREARAAYMAGQVRGMLVGGTDRLCKPDPADLMPFLLDPAHTVFDADDVRRPLLGSTSFSRTLPAPLLGGAGELFKNACRSCSLKTCSEDYVCDSVSLLILHGTH